MAARPRRVAVIDDEPDVLTYLRLALEDAGYEVLACGVPATALARLIEFRPDVVFLDLLMPEQTGVSLFSEIRRCHILANTPVAILSGLNARDDVRALVERDAPGPPPVAYLDKPADVHELLRLLDPGGTEGGTGGAA